MPIEGRSKVNLSWLLVFMLCFLAFAEVAVRFLSVKHVPPSDLPLVDGDFFDVQKVRGKRVLVQRPVGLAFAKNPVFPLRKDPSLKRMLIVGESGALQLGIHLEKVLAESSFRIPLEVMNCGVGGADLATVEAVFDEVVDYSPDIVVLYVGNNIGFSNRPKGGTAWRIAFWLKKSRLVSHFFSNKVAPVTEGRQLNRMKFFFERVAAWASSHRVPVVVCTVPVNLRQAPFTGPKTGEPDDLYWRAHFLYYSGAMTQAIDILQSLTEKDPRPIYHYRLGDWLLRAGKLGPARYHLQRAVDLTFERASAETNQIIRTAANDSPNVLLFDIESLMLNRTPSGILGFEFLEDACHLLPVWLDESAVHLLELLREKGFLKIPPVSGRTAAPETTRSLVERSSFPPSDDSIKIFDTMSPLLSLLFDRNGVAAEADLRELLLLDGWSAPSLKTAFDWSPRSRALLCLGCAEFFSDRKQWKEAADYITKAKELQPLSDLPHIYMGNVHLRQQRESEAHESFQNAAKMNPKRRATAIFLSSLEEQSSTVAKAQ